MPLHVENTGSTKYIILILVDSNDSSNFWKKWVVIECFSKGEPYKVPKKKYRYVICHHLNINVIKKRFRWKCIIVSEKRVKALKDEIYRLLDVRLIMKSFYMTWLTNQVLVKKPNEKWRNCVNFTDINKVCPEDNIHLLWIDQLVNATVRHTLLNFINTYLGYNEISIYGRDRETMSILLHFW